MKAKHLPRILSVLKDDHSYLKKRRGVLIGDAQATVDSLSNNVFAPSVLIGANTILSHSLLLHPSGCIAGNLSSGLTSDFITVYRSSVSLIGSESLSSSFLTTLSPNLLSVSSAFSSALSSFSNVGSLRLSSFYLLYNVTVFLPKSTVSLGGHQNINSGSQISGFGNINKVGAVEILDLSTVNLLGSILVDGAEQINSYSSFLGTGGRLQFGQGAFSTISSLISIPSILLRSNSNVDSDLISSFRPSILISPTNSLFNSSSFSSLGNLQVISSSLIISNSPSYFLGGKLQIGESLLSSLFGFDGHVNVIIGGLLGSNSSSNVNTSGNNEISSPTGINSNLDSNLRGQTSLISSSFINSLFGLQSSSAVQIGSQSSVNAVSLAEFVFSILSNGNISVSANSSLDSKSVLNIGGRSYFATNSSFIVDGNFLIIAAASITSSSTFDLIFVDLSVPDTVEIVLNVSPSKTIALSIGKLLLKSTSLYKSSAANANVEQLSSQTGRLNQNKSESLNINELEQIVGTIDRQRQYGQFIDKQKETLQNINESEQSVLNIEQLKSETSNIEQQKTYILER